MLQLLKSLADRALSTTTVPRATEILPSAAFLVCAICSQCTDSPALPLGHEERHRRHQLAQREQHVESACDNAHTSTSCCCLWMRV